MQHIQLEEVRELVEHGRLEDLRTLLSEMDPADVADLVEAIDDPEEQDRVFAMLEPVMVSDVVAEMEAGPLDELAEHKTPEELANILTNMAPDDAADVIEELELPTDELREILRLIPEEERTAISELLRYEEDSGGSIMTPELCALPSNTSVIDALKAIGEADLSDPIMQVYVVEIKTGVLLGYVNIVELLAHSETAGDATHTFSTKVTLGDLVKTNYVWATTDDDQEKIARDFRRYNLWVMPVVDKKHKLVGRITADDIMDVIQEEADEDMAKMIGAPDFEEHEESPFKAVRMRLPWLLITMVAGLLNAMLIDNIQAATKIAAVSVFVPVLMAMGGNTSIQATAIAVREIAMGRLGSTHLGKTIWKQILIGAMMGLVAASVVWVGAYGVLEYVVQPEGIIVSRLCWAIAAAMFTGMVFASVFGSVVPVILDKLHIDPAVASGPFVTTSNDLSASLIYFGTCALLIMN